jgi:NADPH-dependent 2,4-dienoyl-CoA reductase/sulfur reductase-like enzyme/rhodanese-related sulfurtransferase
MKIVIVGGVAGGASAAARARRLDEHAEIILLQKDNDVSYASCGMPYYIGGEITDRAVLAVQTPDSLKERMALDVRVRTQVTDIQTKDNYVMVQNMATGEVYKETYDHLILSPGSVPFMPPIPGIERPGVFSLRNLQDMDAIAEWIQQHSDTVSSPELRHAVVVGAGFIGLEMVEQLMNRNMRVTLVERMTQILGPLDPEMAILLEHDLKQRGVDVITGDAIEEIVAAAAADNREASILKLQSGRVLPPAHITILGLGVRPDTLLLKDAGIALTPFGHVIVNEHLQTSIPNIWAAGDCIQVNNPILPGEQWAVPLAGPANRQGRMIADNILLTSSNKRTYKGTYGVSVVRSFDQVAACVGVNEKMLCQKKIPYATVHIHPNSHAGYYPGASQIHMKLIFDKESGKVFGAQAIGQDGVEKRMDVIATAIQGNMTVADLAELELCYAPPVGSAKDPVNYAGMVACNIMEGLVSKIEWNDLERLAKRDDTTILDVRNPSEIAKSGPIADVAINIPLNDLRSRLNELSKERRLVVSCASGQRAYYACRILVQNGFENVVSLDGAFLTFHSIHPDAAHAAG